MMNCLVQNGLQQNQSSSAGVLYPPSPPMEHRPSAILHQAFCRPVHDWLNFAAKLLCGMKQLASHNPTWSPLTTCYAGHSAPDLCSHYGPWQHLGNIRVGAIWALVGITLELVQCEPQQHLGKIRVGTIWALVALGLHQNWCNINPGRGNIRTCNMGPGSIWTTLELVHYRSQQHLGNIKNGA